MTARRFFVSLLLAGVIGAIAIDVAAADTYYVKRLSELTVAEGELPEIIDHWYGPQLAHGALDGQGEIYVAQIERNGTFQLAIRVAQPRQIAGRVFIYPPTYDPRVFAAEFSIPKDDASETHRDDFLSTKLAFYEARLQADLPGGAWFRHQVRETSAALGRKPPRVEGQRQNFVWRRGNDMEDTYALFSGGRAVSENLQLDRVMPTTEPAKPTVPLASIAGITVREYDWKPLVKDIKPELDPLASLIPFDQHAIFFPSFQALIQMSDYAELHGTPILQAAEPRSESAQTRERYERQLCLPTSALARLLGPQLINSVAVTGGDPYLRTGADVAVLFDAKNVRALRLAIDARVAEGAAGYPAAKPISGEIQGIDYTGARSPDRVVCSYVATLGNTVVVTNSPAQLEQLIDVQQGKRESLTTLDEYVFFRDRYRRDTKDEAALLVLSDATIRRWCGPKWRIATSRRTRAAAVMTDIQATNFVKLARGEVQLGPVHSDRPLVDGGEMLLGPAGVRSEAYGTLAFHTPIIEQDFTAVTKREAEFYARWRDGYQNNWSRFFDPIAVQVRMDKNKLAADVTVMPLIAGTEYRQLIAITQGAKIAKHAADPHDGILAHFVMSFDTDSEIVKSYANLAQGFAAGTLKVNPLSWLGQSIALYVDDDPFWQEMAKAEDEQQFLEHNFHRMPIAVHFEVRSVFHLTTFLTGFRAFVEQTSPGNTVWETKEHNGLPYVQVGPSPQAQTGNEFDKIRIYYAATADGLTVTLNEKLLHRSLDRRAARQKAKAAGEPLPRTGEAWLGDNISVQIRKGFLHLIGRLSSEAYQREMQRIAWSNLPILNEWKRQFPDADPIALHEKFWHRRLICPGGGQYRWDDKWQTMESTVYGHPGKPKEGPALPTALQSVEAANFGITFEDDGIRARVELKQ